MDKYINWSDIWSVLKKVEYEDYDPDFGMNDLVGLLKKAHGIYEVKNNELVFVENYDFSDYRWTSSIIGSDDQHLKIEQNKKLLSHINSERECISWLLNQINESFCDHDENYLKVFYDRYMMNNNVENILEKYRINRKRFYTIMENAEYLVKKAWLLFTPPKDLIDMFD